MEKNHPWGVRAPCGGTEGSAGSRGWRGKGALTPWAVLSITPPSLLPSPKRENEISGCDLSRLQPHGPARHPPAPHLAPAVGSAQPRCSRGQGTTSSGLLRSLCRLWEAGNRLEMPRWYRLWSCLWSPFSAGEVSVCAGWRLEAGPCLCPFPALPGHLLLAAGALGWGCWLRAPGGAASSLLPHCSPGKGSVFPPPERAFH